MSNIPKKIFIVPYRDRIQHKFFFLKQMQFILESDDDYEIYFSHQCDERGFNRGAMKNIGFLAIKAKYPNDYKNMTFIFNDVDTLPFNKIFNYNTVEGVVKHFYGFRFALGGIVAITGADFEKVNGFPCYWGWGMEDSGLQLRCQQQGIIIDRSVFYPIGSPEILQLFEGIKRLITRTDPSPKNEAATNNVNGLLTIFNLEYKVENQSPSFKDNMYTVPEIKSYYINVKSFDTMIPYDHDLISYDLRDQMPTNKEKTLHMTSYNKKTIPHKVHSELQKRNINNNNINNHIHNNIASNKHMSSNNQSALPKTFRLHRRGKFSFL